MLEVGDPFVERLAHLAVAREVGDITDQEYEMLRARVVLDWRLAWIAYS